MNSNPLSVRREQVGGVTLPVPAEKIKEIRAEIRNLQINIITDKVIIQGIIHKQIFFVDLNGIVRHFPEDVSFSTFIDVPGALPEMHAQVDVEIEHIKAELSPDGKRITQKVILEIFVKVVDEVQFNINLNPSGPLVKLEAVVGENIKQDMVVNEIELPFLALKIADIVAEIRINDIEVIPNKVIIQGIIHKQVFYIDETNIERHIAEDVPFSTFLDVPGALPGDNVQVNAVIEIIKRELNAIPGNILTQEIVFEIFVKVHRTEQMNIELGGGPLIKLPFVIGENTKQDLVVSDIELENPAIKVKDIDVTLRDIRTVVITDKVIVQGTVHKQIYYVDQNNIERHQAEDVPFRNFLDIPGALSESSVDFNPVIEDVLFTLLPGNILHQKVVLQYFVKVTELQQANVVPGSGPLVKVEEVIGENTKQILVERRFPPEIVVPITVTREVIRVAEGAEQMVQKILTNTFTLPTQAVKVKSITPTIRNVEIDVLVDQILITGELVKQVTFVDLNNVVRSVTEIVPFEFLLETPGVTPDVTVDDIDVEIESLTFKLQKDCQSVDQTIVFKFTIGLEDAEQLFVVTNVSGPGIVTDTVRARAEVVVIPDEPGLIELGPIPVESAVDLIPPAIEILDIIATVQEFTVETEDGAVRFTGIINKEVIYLTENEIETTETELVPFDILFEDTAIEADFIVPEAFVSIVDIQPTLSDDGALLEQAILLTFEFKVTDERIITIVTDVSGPGIGTVTKETILLDIVGDGVGPVPVEVVTDVEIL